MLQDEVQDTLDLVGVINIIVKKNLGYIGCMSAGDVDVNDRVDILDALQLKQMFT